MLIFFFLTLLLPISSPAIVTSEHALRIEDSKEGNVVLGADEARLEKGEMYHLILLLWGNLEVYGEVDQVMVLSGHVKFYPGSKLNKSLVLMGGTFESEPGAQVPPENVVAKVPDPAWRLLRSAGNIWRENIDWVSRLGAGLFFCLIAWACGLVLFRLSPGLQRETEARLAREWGANLAMGFLGSIAACVIPVFLFVSVLGIVLVPFYLLALLLASLVSYLAAALWAGHRLLPPKGDRKLNPWGFLLGLFALQFLWTVPVWWAALPVFVLWLLGWGALLRGIRLLWR